MSKGDPDSQEVEKTPIVEVLQGVVGIILTISGLSGLIGVILNETPSPQVASTFPIASPSISMNSASLVVASSVSEQTAYDEAMRLADQAASLATQGKNNTLSSAQWETIEALWHQAIELLEKIPPASETYQSGKVREKIEAYKNHESYANRAKRAAPWLQAVRLADQASTLSQTAKTPDDWTKISELWQQALELVESVPSDSEYYPNATSRVSEYQRKLEYSQQQQYRN